MARKSSLGPFPKTHRWNEIVRRCGSSIDADALLAGIRGRIEKLVDDPQAISAVTFFVALPVATRFPDPAAALEERFGIEYRSSLRETLEAWIDPDTVPHAKFEAHGLGAHATSQPSLRAAAMVALDRFVQTGRFAQARLGREDDWSPWRELDGSAFCEVGRMFFACLVELYLLASLPSSMGTPVHETLIRQHAWELSRITQSFSARWFNKCAVDQIPDRGNIRWYLGHCLGKLDMELERELCTHVEPLPNPSRRRKIETPSLGLGL